MCASIYERRRTTLGGDDTPFAQGAVQELKVWLLKKALRGTLGVRAVGNDNIEFILFVREEFEAVADVGLDFGVLEADAHAGQVFLGDADDGLAERGLGVRCGCCL